MKSTLKGLDTPGGTRREPELLDLLASGSPPAFATNSEDRIVFWNRGAEEILGRTADEVLGKTCHDIVAGRDVFGNRFCYENCPVVATTKAGEPVRGYEFVAPTRKGEAVPLAVTILRIPGTRRDAFTIVHLLQPVNEAGRIQKALESLISESRAAADPNALIAIQPPPSSVPPLTTREKEILRWIAAGLQNKEIAQKLGISLATVRNHIRNILEKLDVHSKLEAVSMAFRNGWVGAAADDKPPG